MTTINNRETARPRHPMLGVAVLASLAASFWWASWSGLACFVAGYLLGAIVMVIADE